MGDSFDEDTPTPPRPPSERTPPQLRRRSWGDAERAAVGAQHRRQQSNPFGVPLAADPVLRELGSPDSGPLQDREITSPVDLLDRDLSQDELEVVRRSRRNSGDPATYADVVKLAERLINRERKDRSSREEQANQLLALLDRPPHEAVQTLQADVAAMKISVEALTRWWRPIRAVMIFLAIAALGGVGFFVDQLLVHAEARTEAAIKIDHLERAVEGLRLDLHGLLYSPAPDRAWPHLPAPQPVPKDPPP